MEKTCPVCGGQGTLTMRVLWPELIQEWGLAPHEVDYIDRQQGELCVHCHASRRHVALTEAFRTALGDTRTLREIVAAAPQISVLDINGAEVISDTLSGLPHYLRADYPEVDLQALPYAENSFDIVLHSDTLEHVPYALRALDECRRVLKPGGTLCYTIPIIVGRMTRSRLGMPPSYHGMPSDTRDDYIVQTEYGADAWTELARAGFTQIGIHTVDFPVAQAFTARK